MISEEQLHTLGYTLKEQSDNEKIYYYKASYCSNLIAFYEGRVTLKLCIANIGDAPASGIFEDFDTFKKWFIEYTTQ